MSDHNRKRSRTLTDREGLVYEANDPNYYVPRIRPIVRWILVISAIVGVAALLWFFVFPVVQELLPENF